jgi:hypothetical protein
MVWQTRMIRREHAKRVSPITAPNFRLPSRTPAKLSTSEHPGERRTLPAQSCWNCNCKNWWNAGRLIIANAIRHRLPNQILFHRFMTELEQHLLSALKRLESQYQERDRLFADTLNSLSKQLNDGAQRIETLNSQVTVLNGRIERLQTILTKR